MLRPRFVASLMLLAATLSVAACGSDKPAATPTNASTANNANLPPAPDPCTLVTQADVAAALGEPVEAGKPEQGGLPSQRTCAFKATGSAAIASVGLVRGDTALFQQMRLQAGSTIKDLPGLGEEAYRDAGYLTARKGDLLLLIFVSGQDSDEEYASVTTKLATSALAHL